MNLISEFFHEGISHIIPGLVIITLYWHSEAENIFHKHGHLFSSPLIFIACVLVIAWLIGLMVDAIIFVTTRVFLKIFLRDFNGCKHEKWLLSFLLNQNKNSTHNSNKADKHEMVEMRRQESFISATIMMSRCLWFVFLFSLFRVPQLLPDFDWNRYHSFGCFSAFLILWVWFKFSINPDTLKKT